MRINCNNISPGTVLWYRKKGSWDVDCLTVKKLGQNGFTFSLRNGTERSCSYEYASGRLYKDRNDLSTYRPQVDLDRTYGGWAGKANSWGEPFNTGAMINESSLPDDDDWICRELQYGMDAPWST